MKGLGVWIEHLRTAHALHFYHVLLYVFLVLNSNWFRLLGYLVHDITFAWPAWFHGHSLVCPCKDHSSWPGGSQTVHSWRFGTAGMPWNTEEWSFMVNGPMAGGCGCEAVCWFFKGLAVLEVTWGDVNLEEPYNSIIYACLHVLYSYVCIYVCYLLYLSLVWVWPEPFEATRN